MSAPIEVFLDRNVEWTENPPPKDDGSGLPWATHSGVLDFLGHKIRVHRLSDGQRVIDADDADPLLQDIFGAMAVPDTKATTQGAGEETKP